MTRVLLVLLLLLVLPGGAQQPSASFSLRSDRSFAPGEPVRIELSSLNVDALEFRVYRVNDPVEFFRQLPDTNSFGGEAPPVPSARTPLERLQRWKERTRYALRRVVREQFGDDEHRALTAFLRKPAAGAPIQPDSGAKRAAQPGVEFAEVPLLNSEQLVRQWRVPVGKKRSPWEGQAVDFEVPGAGLYIVEAAAQGLRAATIVSVTPWALVQKSAPGRVLAQLADRRSGLPVAGVGVSLIDGTTEAGKSATDERGLVDFRVPSSKLGESPKVILVASRDRESAMSPVSGWAVREHRDALAAGFVYTDRPMYRPGDKVGFRAILRGEDSAGWKLPEVAEVDCEITGPEGEAVDRRRLKVSRFGTVSGEWTAPAGAGLGYYSVLIRAEGSAQAGSFQVEEYRKPEYEVKVTAAGPRILQGNVAQFVIDAQYFFGEPVAGGKVKYSVRRTRAWHWFSGDYDPEDFEGGDTDFYGEVLVEKEGVLDRDGKLVVPVPVRLHANDEEYRLEAKVTDAARREVAGRGLVLATVGSYALQARAAKYVYAPGETAVIEVEAWNYDRTLRPGTPFEVQLGESRARGVTNDQGKGSVSLPVAGSKTQSAIARSRTPEGRTVTDTDSFWVTAGYVFDAGTTNIEIVPDRKSYRPGDTARLLMVPGAEDTPVLVSVEARGILHHEVVRASGPSLVYELPIVAAHMPNVYVTASFLKDGRHYVGSKSVKVPTDKVLDVTLIPSKPQFTPGEPASYRLEAKDASGKPVQGEFSLGVVDEAVYGVEPDRVMAIDRFFHGRQYNRVNTSSSLSFYFYGQAGKRSMPIAAVRSRIALGQVKPPRVFDPRVRKDFRDTALWLANVETGADGRADVRLQFPDAITAWRATARGVTVDTKVGSAVNRVVTRKDLILRTAAPRFLTEGDEVTVSAIVNNYLPGDRGVKVTMEAEGLEAIDGKERTGTAIAKAETPFDFRVRAGKVGSAKLTLKAFADGGADAMEIEIPIRPYGVRVTQSWSGTLDGKMEQAVGFPSGAVGRSIDVRTLPSLAGAIFGGLEYLAAYPYGCTEQTLSSFVPNALVMRALKELKVPVRDRGRIERQKMAGLQRLADFQRPDGGWGFWQADDSNAFMTASVAAALEDLGEWGPVRREDAQNWLRRALAAATRTTPDFRAFLAYALNEPAALDAIWADRERLSTYGQALAGLRGSPEQALAMTARLEQTAIAEGSEVHWTAARDVAMDLDIDASAEVTALAVKLLTRTKPDSPLIPKAVQWLVNHRNEGYFWTSTKQTSAVVAGLIDYLKRSGELDPKLAVEVRSNGELIWNKELVQADALSPHPAGVRIVPVADQARVAVSASGRGKLYWSITANHYDAEPRLDRGGLEIQRQYLRELPGGARTAFDGVAKPGETIISRITVSGRGAKWLAVEDPIAAGAEWVRADGFDSGQELRDDRAVTLLASLDRVRTIETRMRVVRPGSFRISPARVSAMYQPGVMASTGGARSEVRP